jgi:prepilin-type N-terminal cleavage/methylation domain-containing protein
MTLDRIRTRLASDAGFTLTELLVTLILMGVVMGAIMSSFAGAFVGETRAIAEATNEENARLALQRLRMDIHCAKDESQSPGVTSQGGYYIILTEIKDTSNLPICRKISLPTSSNWVSWCTIQVSATRWQLFRDDVQNCTGTGATFMVDYIVQPNIWTVPTCVSGWQLSVGVSLITNQFPGNTQYQYSLSDSIGMRNARRYTSGAAACP